MRLEPTPDEASALADELTACNEGASWVSRVAFEHFGLKAGEVPLRKLVYAELRERGVKSAAAQQLIAKVVDGRQPGSQPGPSCKLGASAPRS